MKLNKKGFVSSAVLYSLLLLFLALILGLLSLLSNRKQILDKLKGDIKNEINQTKIYEVYENGTAIYYNPVTGKICGDYKKENSLNENKTGCMKWYIFNDNKNRATVNMILDHNTTALVAWNSEGTNTEMKEVKTALESDTSNWKQTARLITADEVAHIVGADKDDNIKWNSSKTYGNDNIETKVAWFYLDGTGTTYSSTDGWQKQVATTQGASKYAWLYDYMNGCTSYGCNTDDSSNYGYWTSTPVVGTSSSAWNVYRRGYLDNLIVGIDRSNGVRPVITITKKQIEEGKKDKNVYNEYATTTLNIIKNKIDDTTTEGLYFFDKDANLDYGDNTTKIELNLINKSTKGNVNIWNKQVIYACFNYGEYNFEFDTKTKKITERDMPCLINRYDNLVINGDLIYKSNYNLTEFGTYNEDGYITKEGKSTTYSTDFIPIDSNKKYELGLDIKSSNTTSTYFAGFMEYDVDKNLISDAYVMYMSNTLTTLSKDLNKGDTIVYLTDLTNWNVNTSTRTYQRGFIFWNYEDSAGYKYPELTYSRNVIYNLYNDSNIDKIDNTITLNSAWTGDTIKAGTKLSQSNSGSSYNYSILSNGTISTNWTSYKTTSNITGVNSNNNSNYKFRPGTKYIKFMIMENHNSTANTTTDIKNIYIKEVK